MLNQQQVWNIAGKQIPIVSSADMHKYNTLEEMMDGHNAILILYQDRHGPHMRAGHWCGLSEMDPDNIAFYDSYGKEPDIQLNHIPMKYRKRTRQVYNHLARMLHDSNYKNIHYNPYQHQKSKKGINTCGRHVGMFLRLNIDPEDYHKIIKKLTKYLDYKSPDELVTDLTKQII